MLNKGRNIRIMLKLLLVSGPEPVPESDLIDACTQDGSKRCATMVKRSLSKMADEGWVIERGSGELRSYLLTQLGCFVAYNSKKPGKQTRRKMKKAHRMGSSMAAVLAGMRDIPRAWLGIAQISGHFDKSEYDIRRVMDRLSNLGLVTPHPHGLDLWILTKDTTHTAQGDIEDGHQEA